MYFYEFSVLFIQKFCYKFEYVFRKCLQQAHLAAAVTTWNQRDEQDSGARIHKRKTHFALPYQVRYCIPPIRVKFAGKIRGFTHGFYLVNGLKINQKTYLDSILKEENNVENGS